MTVERMKNQEKEKKVMMRIPDSIKDRIDMEHIIEKEDGTVVCFLKSCKEPGLKRAKDLLTDAYEDRILNSFGSGRVA